MDKNSSNLLLFEHLNRMVPSHTTVRKTASYKNNFRLSFFCFNGKGWSHQGTDTSSNSWPGEGAGDKGRSASKGSKHDDSSGLKFHLWNNQKQKLAKAVVGVC